MPEPLAGMPSAFAAGTTVKVRMGWSEYPAGSGWAATLHLRGVGTLDVEGVPYGDAFLFTLAAADTADLAAGTYRWVVRTEVEADVYTAASGVVTVTLDLGAAAAGDGQTHAERTLALLEAAIEGRIPQGMESYQVGGRAVTKIPLRDLVQLAGTYRAIVQRQRNPKAALGGIRIRFTG